MSRNVKIDVHQRCHFSLMLHNKKHRYFAEGPLFLGIPGIIITADMHFTRH